MFYFGIFVFFLSSAILCLAAVRARQVVSFVVVITASLFFVFNRQNHDYEAYIKIFENPSIYAEPGYSFLVDIIKLFGGGHEFVLLTLGGVVAFTFFRIGKYVRLVGFSVLCYFIFPMPSDIVQIRNTFASLLFLNSLLELSLRRYLASVFFILLSFLFHYIGIVYFFVFCASFLRDKKYFKMIVFFVFIGVFLFIPFLLSFPEFVSEFRTLRSYVSSSIKVDSFFIWGVPILSQLIICSFFARKMDVDDTYINSLVAIYKAALLFSIAFLPGLLFIDEFNRFYRAMFVVSYLMAACIAQKLSLVNRLVLLFSILIFPSVFGLYYAIGLDYDYVLFGL